MNARVQCPQCQSYCQIPAQYIGATVKCGKCAQPFVAQSGQVPAPPAPPDLKPSAGPAKSVQEAGANLWSGLRGLVQSITSAPASPAAPPSPPQDADEVEEIGLELDGLESLAASAPKPPAPNSVVRLDLGSATAPGKVRTRNEDSFLVQQWSWANLDQRHEVALIVLADGMGGYEAGDKASNLVIRQVGAALATALSQMRAADVAPAQTALTDTMVTAIKAANRLILGKGQTEPGCKGMGATAAAVVIVDGQAMIGHIGDCRVYHQRGLDLTQITRDQTLVARMVEMGKLSPVEALTHPLRNEVTQAIGKNPDIHPAVHELKLSAGDWLIVACDGLHAHVDAAQLNDAVRAADPSAGLLARQLVDLADQGGGSDNCTVVAVRCY